MLNMNTYKISVASVLATLSILPSALAGFSASSQSNVAVYWGQGNGQESLATYCSNSPVNIIPIAFEVSLLNPATGLNTGNFDPSNVGPDIITCQKAGKTILLSIGGATFTENGLTTTEIAQTAAKNVWSLFGPASGSYSSRPFGDAVVDGFDLDLETPGLDNMAAFVQELRTLMDADTSKQWMLTAAPQCVYPDAADKSFLQGEVAMDAVFVQFYNNPECGVENFMNGEPNAFNLDSWHTWATTISKNPNVKVFIGIPGSTDAAGSGYIESAALAPIIAYAKTFSSFGGIMSWDMVRVVGNTGYLDSVHEALGGAVASIIGGGSTAKATATATGYGSSAKATATTLATGYGSSAVASTPVYVPTTTQHATSAAQTTTRTTVATSIVSTISTLVTKTLTTNSEPGGIFATVPTTAAASSTAIVTSISTPVSIATIIPSSIPTANATKPTSASSPSSTSTSTTSSSQTPGSPCAVDGTWICIPGGTSFQQCGSGIWSAVMQLADGTSCTAGEGQTIDIVAAKERRKRERVSRHMHRHVRSS